MFSVAILENPCLSQIKNKIVIFSKNKSFCFYIQIFNPSGFYFWMRSKISISIWIANCSGTIYWLTHSSSLIYNATSVFSIVILYLSLQVSSLLFVIFSPWISYTLVPFIIVHLSSHSSPKYSIMKIFKHTRKLRE